MASHRSHPDTNVPHSASANRPSAAREWIWVVVVLMAAALLRIIYLVVASDRLATYSVPIIDAAYYDQWARSVASGLGYGPSPFYLAPLYPYAIACIYALGVHDYVAVYMLQAGLGLANLFMVYLLGRRLFRHRSALVAMILVMLYAPILMLEGKLLSETLGMTLTLAALLLILRSIDRKGVGSALTAGIVLGLSVLCRSSNLLFALLLAAWLVFRALRQHDRSWWWRLVGVGAGVAVAILPVTIRNAVVGRDLVLIQTNLGMTFAQGNNENARGVVSHPPGTSAGIASQQAEEMAIAARELGRAVKPSESSAFWLRKSLRWMHENPSSALALLGRKLVYAFNNREEQDSFETSYELTRIPLLKLLCVPFSILPALAIIGAVRSPQIAANGVQVLGLYILTILATLVVFYVSSRYRVLCVPVLAVLAGHGLLQLVEWIRLRAALPLVLSVGLLAATTAVGAISYPMSRSMGAFTHLNVAERLATMNRPDQAAQVLRDGLRLSPGSTELYGELGLLLARMGRYPEAVQNYEMALQHHADVLQLQLNMAAALERMHQYARAEEHWARALQLNPNAVQAYANRGASRFNRGRLDEAIHDFTEAIRCEPDSPLAHNSLGAALLQLGRRDEGIGQLQRAVQLDPRYTTARHNLAMALTAAGRIDQAIAEYRQVLKLEPNNPRVRAQLDALLSARVSPGLPLAPPGR